MLKDDVEGTENGRMSFYSLQFFRYVWLSFGWSASKFLPLHYNLNPLSRLSYRYPDNSLPSVRLAVCIYHSGGFGTVPGTGGYKDDR